VENTADDAEEALYEDDLSNLDKISFNSHHVYIYLMIKIHANDKYNLAGKTVSSRVAKSECTARNHAQL